MQKTLWFKSENLHLHGTLHLPEANRPPVIIGSHGLLSNGDSPKQIALAEKCNDAGIAFFRFDHRGCGKSEGRFNEVTSLEGRRRDLLAAVQILHDLRKTDHYRIGLFGSSFGGAAVLATAREIKPLAIVTVAAPIRTRAIQQSYINEASTKKMLETMSRENLVFDISGDIPDITNLLIFHGDADPVVAYESALELYERAGSPRELVRLENGDHLMSNKAHQALFIRRSIDWYKTRLLDCG